MNDLITVGDLARELSAGLGEDLPPRVISDLFDNRVLSDDRCTILGGRRLIPRNYIPEIKRALRERQVIPRQVGEAGG